MSRQYPDCGHTRVKGDRHRRCVACLGRTHAEAALSGVDPACGVCASLTLAKATKRLAWHRRAEPPVAELAPICVSPDSAPPACAEQGSGRGQRIVIDSPPLAQPAVGGRSGQYVSAAALGAASAERPPNTGAQDSVASPSRVVASQSLAPERCRLIASGLSDAVVATIQSARAVSTRALIR